MLHALTPASPSRRSSDLGGRGWGRAGVGRQMLFGQQPTRQQHRHAHVDAAAFGAFRRDEILDPGQRDAVNGDILAINPAAVADPRSEEHTSELQSLLRKSYAVFGLKQKTHTKT